MKKLLQSIALAVLGWAPSLQAQIESLPQNTMFQDTKPGSYGLRAHGCIPNFNMPKPNDGVDAACVIDSITISTPTNLNGSGGTLFHAWTLDVTGPGRNYGNTDPGTFPQDAGWAGDGIFWFQNHAFRDGISNVIAIEGKSFKDGDMQNFYSRLWCMGGNKDASGEGCTNMSLQGGQQSIYATGYISGTTGKGDLDPLLKITAGHALTSGSMLVDTLAPKVSGTLEYPGSAPMAGSTYLNTLTTSGGLTPSTGSCVTTDRIAGTTVAGVFQIRKFDCKVLNNLRMVSGLAQMASAIAPEQILIQTASSPVNGVQTLTVKMAKGQPAGMNVIQGGTFGCLSFRKNLAPVSEGGIGWMTSYRVFGAVDEKKMIYGFLIHGNTTGNTLPMMGAEPETLDPGSNEYDIFPCAAINYLRGPEGGQLANLEQNDVSFQKGDPFANPQDPAVNMHQLTLDMYTRSPSNGGLSGSIAIGFGGPGVSANFMGFQIVNHTPPGQYRKHRGWAYTPSLFSVYGDFGCVFCLMTVPDKFVKIYDDANTSEYSVWETNAAAGNLSVDQKNKRFRFTSNLRVDGRLSAHEVGPLGVTWGSGSNDPSGSCTTGSLFSNTAGAAGHVFWVCEGGRWVAK